ncbi:MAG: hypothetical protein ABI414_05690, partial [Devosia sp.]
AAAQKVGEAVICLHYRRCTDLAMETTSYETPRAGDKLTSGRQGDPAMWISKTRITAKAM